MPSLELFGQLQGVRSGIDSRVGMEYTGKVFNVVSEVGMKLGNPFMTSPEAGGAEM